MAVAAGRPEHPGRAGRRGRRGPGPAWLDHVRSIVESERLAAVIRHADQLLNRNRHDELITILIDETNRHPLHERLAAQLMLAFYRAGQQANALRAYHRIRVELRDELGVTPGTAIQDLHHQILCGDPTLAQVIRLGAQRSSVA